MQDLLIYGCVVCMHLYECVYVDVDEYIYMHVCVHVFLWMYLYVNVCMVGKKNYLFTFKNSNLLSRLLQNNIC